MSDKPSAASSRPQHPLRLTARATRHFITQRITGALNILFTIFLVWFVVSLAGPTRRRDGGAGRHPFVAIGLGC
jgi:succinate dehydrogenase hydrophobic anchor subunit